MSGPSHYDAGHVSVDCEGCGAMCFELCLCRARDERRERTSDELEQGRQGRLNRNERQALNCGEKP